MENRITVKVDFSKKMPNDLIKKFGVYVCTYVDLERMIRDIRFLPELKPITFRYDLGWGFGNTNELNSAREIDAPQISGSAEEIVIKFDGLDRLVNALAAKDVDIMLVHAYNPVILQNPVSQTDAKFSETLIRNSMWNTCPADLDQWQSINQRYAAHWAEKGLKIKYYEVWNEPDLQPVFFTEPKEKFFEIYKYGVTGIKEGDPDALVGGPALSKDLSWAPPFLEYIKRNNLPLDFFSFHAYGDASDMIDNIRKILKQHQMDQIDILLTEYNSYVPATADFTTGGAIERHEAAAMMLHDFKCFLEMPDIKEVHWAQYDDPEVFGKGVDRCGMISLDGRKKASFNAFKIYADMPLSRADFLSDHDGIEGMASCDGNRYCAVLWNMTDKDQDIRIAFTGMDGCRVDMSLVRIDAAHGSYIDNPLCEELSIDQYRRNVSPSDCTWEGIIPTMGVMYFTLQKSVYKGKGE